MKVDFSRAVMMWMLSLSLGIFASACGYLDEDIGLSDDDYEASFEQGGSLTGGGMSSSGSYSHGSGSACGIAVGAGSHGHHHGHHPSIGRLVHPDQPGTTIIDMAPSHIAARSGTSAGVIVDREPGEDENEAGAPIYAAGELETWGDYLEAELQRVQQGRRQARGSQ
jgi:hypothetical protein